jgi:hypothetical protein
MPPPSEEDDLLFSAPPPPKLTVQEHAKVFLRQWNALPPVIKKARHIRGQRLVTFRARISDPQWVEDYPAALEKIPESPFLMGENDRGWTPTIDWILRPDRVDWVIEGKYMRARPAPDTQKPKSRSWNEIDYG